MSGAQPSVGVSDRWLECADGVRLASRIWMPAGRGPWPVLLMRQPYGRRIASTVTYAHPHWYASQGYAVVVQDVRGRGESGGHFSGFAQEAADGATTLAWLRSQSWCNGRIGTYGFSYQGLSQLLLSGEHLPDALAPAMAGLDERRHWASDGGCHWWALGVGWALQLAAQAAQRRGDLKGWQQIRTSLESGTFLRDGMALLRQHDPGGMGLAWLERDAGSSEGWRVHSPPEALWRKPMLLIGGWHDPHLGGVLDLWQRAQTPMLRIGNWSHLNWQGGIDALQLAFFDRVLRDRSGSGCDPACLLQDLGSGHWLERSPSKGSGQCWGLRSNGLAAVDSREGVLCSHSSYGSSGSGGCVVVVHDPWRPLPGRGGHLGLDAGVVERADLDQRTDVACFTTAALEQPLELLGQPVLSLAAACDQLGFDLCVALSVLEPSGRVRQISTGVARFLAEAASNLQQRRVALQPLLLTLAAGERLRLAIGLAAWPQIAVNPGDGSQPQGAATANHRVISVTLELSEAQLQITPMLPAEPA